MSLQNNCIPVLARVVTWDWRNGLLVNVPFSKCDHLISIPGSYMVGENKVPKGVLWSPHMISGMNYFHIQHKYMKQINKIILPKNSDRGCEKEIVLWWYASRHSAKIILKIFL